MTTAMADSKRPAPTATADRRAAPRVLVDLQVDYGLEDNYLFAYITDISATGIFVRTTTPAQQRTHLNLRLTPGVGEGEIEVAGEPLWLNPCQPRAPVSIN